MASTRVAMASNLLAMASNLIAIWFLDFLGKLSQTEAVIADKLLTNTQQGPAPPHRRTASSMTVGLVACVA